MALRVKDIFYIAYNKITIKNKGLRNCESSSLFLSADERYNCFSIGISFLTQV